MNVKKPTVLMLLLMLLCQWRPAALIALFSAEAQVIETGASFLRIISWTFPVSGIVFTCSGVFQALGNTVPALLGSALRMGVYCAAAFWLASQPGLQLEYVWYAVVATMVLHVLVSLALLKGQLRTRLAALEPLSQA